MTAAASLRTTKPVLLSREHIWLSQFTPRGHQTKPNETLWGRVDGRTVGEGQPLLYEHARGLQKRGWCTIELRPSGGHMRFWATLTKTGLAELQRLYQCLAR